MTLSLVNSKGVTLATFAEPADLVPGIAGPEGPPGPMGPPGPAGSVTPTPPALGAPPPWAVAAGYTSLAFSDDFTGTTLDLTKWGRGLWYNPDPGAAPFSVANSILTITSSAACPEPCITSAPNRNLAQAYAPTFGAFQARMKGDNWFAFWLMSLAHMNGTVPTSSNPLTECSEIDWIEGDSGNLTKVYNALHMNTGSQGGIPDQYNQGVTDSSFNVGVDITQEFHLYGGLWTPTTVQFYFDNVLTRTVLPYPSTPQPMLMILDVWPGGVTGSPAVGTPTNEIDWVQVWQKAA